MPDLDALLDDCGVSAKTYGKTPENKLYHATRGLRSSVGPPGGREQLDLISTVGRLANGEVLTSGGNPQIVEIARRQLGIPYVWGGASPTTGFDCQGLVTYVYGQAGLRIPGGVVAQFNATTAVLEGMEQPGDLVFFQNTHKPGPSHVGIYIGNGQLIEAPRTGSVVKISDVRSPYKLKHWAGFRRLGGVGSGAAFPAYSGTIAPVRGIKAKPGVDLSRLAAPLASRLDYINGVWKVLVGRDAIVTSTFTGKHMTGSLHYVNLAIDLRTNDLPIATSERITQQLRAVLGAGYQVIFEKDAPGGQHIHIEYDPR